MIRVSWIVSSEVSVARPLYEPGLRNHSKPVHSQRQSAPEGHDEQLMKAGHVRVSSCCAWQAKGPADGIEQDGPPSGTYSVASVHSWCVPASVVTQRQVWLVIT